MEGAGAGHYLAVHNHDDTDSACSIPDHAALKLP